MTTEELLRMWTEVHPCKRCGGVCNGGRDLCARCRADDLTAEILRAGMSQPGNS